MKKLFYTLPIIASLFGCSTQEIPQAHKGRLFDKTGLWALYSGGKGFEGPILGPGTVFTGMYPEVRMIDCGQRTVKEPLEALTKDGVQFNLDVYIRYSANCDEDKSVEILLSTLSPAGVDPIPTDPPKDDKKDDPNKENKNDVQHESVEKYPEFTITSKQIYSVYVRPGLGEAVRESVSAYIANEINEKRDEMFLKIKGSFNTYIEGQGKNKLVSVYSLNLSNLDFPDQLEHANTDRATQAVLKDKAIAERERVTAEIETTKMRKQLSENEATNDVVKIDAIGAALNRNPLYLQYDAQQRWNEIYARAGEHGNMIIAAPTPNTIMMQGKK